MLIYVTRNADTAVFSPSLAALLSFERSAGTGSPSLYTPLFQLCTAQRNPSRPPVVAGRMYPPRAAETQQQTAGRQTILPHHRRRRTGVIEKFVFIIIIFPGYDLFIYIIHFYPSPPPHPPPRASYYSTRWH